MKKSILFTALLLSALCSQAVNPHPHYGIASYYNVQRNHHRTASGEKYYRDSFTAACKIYRFGTYLKVTNLKSHEVVIVKVNDRGPYVKKRMIDLSHAAGDKIGLMPAGLARVKIEPATKEEIKNKNEINKSSSMSGENVRESVIKDPGANLKRFMVQAGSYKLKHSALRLKSYLNRKKMRHVRINTVSINGQTSYNVMIGPLNTNDKKRALRLLRAKQINGLVSVIKAKKAKKARGNKK